jgi:hypothetical protein
MARFTGNLETLGALTQDVASRSGTAEGFAERLTIIRRFADELKPTVDEMEETSAEFLTQINSVDSMMQIIISEVLNGPDDDTQNEGVLRFLASLKGMIFASAEASVGMTESLHGARQMRKMSNILRPVSKSLEQSLNTILRAQAIIAGWDEQLSAWPTWIELSPINPDDDGDDELAPVGV